MLVYFAGLTCGAELMLKVHVLMGILQVALRLAHFLCSPSFGAMYSLGPVNNTNIIQLNVCASSIVLCVGCNIVVMGLPSLSRLLFIYLNPL
jgi:hypothetical protein